MEKAPQNQEINNDQTIDNEEAPKSFEEHMQELAKEQATSQEIELSRSQEQKYGAKILSTINFEVRHKEIVDSSFNKARAQGEKLSGKNSERRNSAYINRLEAIVQQYGPEGEQKLWEASAHKLIDSNRGENYIPDNIVARQTESIKPWVNFLSNNEEYPMWFKVFTWDSMSKMGRFDKELGRYRKRQKGEMTPYPNLNEEAVNNIYEAVLENPNAGIDFGQMYAENILNQKNIVKTPERPEDVHGKWMQYGIGDEAKIAEASIGTPWCIKDPDTARSYLETGFPASEKQTNRASKAQFLLFHLSDQQTGQLSDTACASIRLDPDGKVAEISGLDGGQTLEPALVSEVEQKVLSLSGGEKYKEAFNDYKSIIAIKEKTKQGQNLSKEELSFLYGLDKPIKHLNGQEDSKIGELRSQHSIDELLKSGLSVNKILSKVDDQYIINNIESLLGNGVGINKIVSRLDSASIAGNLDILVANKAKINPDKIIKKLLHRGDVLAVTRNLDSLEKHGANIDIKKIESKLQENEVCDSFDVLIKHGANVDLNQLAKKYAEHIVSDKLEAYLQVGGDPNILLSNLSKRGLERHRKTLHRYGLLSI